MDSPFVTPFFDANDANRGIAFLKSEYIIEFSNEKLSKMMNLSRKDVHHLDLRQYIHAQDLAQYKPDLDKFFKGELCELNIKLRLIRNDGVPFWVQNSYYRINDDSNNLIYWIIVFTEISENCLKNRF